VYWLSLMRSSLVAKRFRLRTLPKQFALVGLVSERRSSRAALRLSGCGSPDGDRYPRQWRRSWRRRSGRVAEGFGGGITDSPNPAGTVGALITQRSQVSVLQVSPLPPASAGAVFKSRPPLPGSSRSGA
jgi:hypothetical protein